MNKRIIYEEAGEINVVHPAEKTSVKDVTLSVVKPNDSLEEIARKKKAIRAQKLILAIHKDREVTELEWLTFVAMKDIPDGLRYEIVESSAVPLDKEYRGAWKKGAGLVYVDMPLAREIHMGRVRAMRNKELDKTDKDVSRELESGPVLKATKDKRQFLRDIPQTFDLSAVSSPEELKIKWPVGLPRN